MSQRLHVKKAIQQFQTRDFKVLIFFERRCANFECAYLGKMIWQRGRTL